MQIFQLWIVAVVLVGGMDASRTDLWTALTGEYFRNFTQAHILVCVVGTPTCMLGCSGCGYVSLVEILGAVL